MVIIHVAGSSNTKMGGQPLEKVLGCTNIEVQSNNKKELEG